MLAIRGVLGQSSNRLHSGNSLTKGAGMSAHNSYRRFTS